MNRYDAFTALIICLCALGVYFAFGFRIGSSENLTALIYEDGSLLAEYDLSGIKEKKTIDFNGVTAEISKDGVCITEAECADKSCVKRGRITKSGEIIVCVPNRIVIRLSGGGGIDAVSY